jgi:hypothetical protein
MLCKSSSELVGTLNTSVLLVLQARAADNSPQEISQWSTPTSLEALLHQLDTCKVAALLDVEAMLALKIRDILGM